MVGRANPARHLHTERGGCGEILQQVMLGRRTRPGAVQIDNMRPFRTCLGERNQRIRGLGS